ncbi:MAG: helix-turn-helix domain-containing protein [Burkholderiaceae bacterium]|jgi:transcriptional regulator with XRE-family HTH domain|nr:helix-turn-helix domain-containing protein [Burkholderiaceae bacterium]
MPGKLLIETFGTEVRRLREGKGWSQEELAARAGLNRSYLGEIERGDATASLLSVGKLACALGLNLTGLLARCDQITGRLAPEDGATASANRT